MLNRDTQTIAGLQLHVCHIICRHECERGGVNRKNNKQNGYNTNFLPQRPNISSNLPTRYNGRQTPWKTLKARPGWGVGGWFQIISQLEGC